MTIDEYMDKLPLDRRERIMKLLRHIKTWFPGAVVTMKYKMPTIEKNGNWVAVANQKNYIALYTCSEEHIAPYIEKHPDIRHGKGCINFRDNDEIRYDDLKNVVSGALNAKNTHT
ncbi:MAG: DUF1801 domain-containing protein [Deltaproteobacteria bacterium]